ncbi:MAG: DNA-deoxyinosine glycosylase [Methylomicrobium sp.]
MLIEGFPPIVGESARILILGSMPGVASLSKGQYYGHARNAFWPIMGELLGAWPGLAYAERQRILLANGIAVWDVVRRCFRPGSADAAIDNDSIETNDFLEFFERYRRIERVCFNGGTAEKLYKQRVLPGLKQRFDFIEYRRLPSTSPAYAMMSLSQKIDSWRCALIEG